MVRESNEGRREIGGETERAGEREREDIRLHVYECVCVHACVRMCLCGYSGCRLRCRRRRCCFSLRTRSLRTPSAGPSRHDLSASSTTMRSLVAARPFPLCPVPRLLDPRSPPKRHASSYPRARRVPPPGTMRRVRAARRRLPAPRGRRLMRSRVSPAGLFRGDLHVHLCDDRSRRFLPFARVEPAFLALSRRRWERIECQSTRDKNAV